MLSGFAKQLSALQQKGKHLAKLRVEHTPPAKLHTPRARVALTLTRLRRCSATRPKRGWRRGAAGTLTGLSRATRSRRRLSNATAMRPTPLRDERDDHMRKPVVYRLRRQPLGKNGFKASRIVRTWDRLTGCPR